MNSKYVYYLSMVAPVASKIFPASMAFHTRWPHANKVMSLPSLNFCALPITKSEPSSLVKFGHFGLQKRKYTGP